MSRALQEKTFNIARYGKKRLTDLLTRYEQTGWRIELDEQAKTITVKWFGPPRRHAKSRARS